MFSDKEEVILKEEEILRKIVALEEENKSLQQKIFDLETYQDMNHEDLQQVFEMFQIMDKRIKNLVDRVARIEDLLE